LLVEAGERSFLVSPAAAALIAALRDSGEVEHVREVMAQAQGRPPTETEIAQAIERLPRTLFTPDAESEPDRLFLFRWPLIGDQQIGRWAAALHGLFEVRVVALVISAAVALVGAALVTERFGVVPGLGSVEESLAVFALLVLSALAHELGHAAACVRLGVQPGHVGAGIYAIFPVLYIDVSRAWRLPAQARALVDVGGMYFQLLVILLLVPLLAWEPPRHVAATVIAFNAGWVLFNLNPVFKMDGYWLLADLTGTPNLQQRAFRYLGSLVTSRDQRRPEGTRRERVIYVGYGLLVLGYLGIVLSSAPGWFTRYLLPGVAACATAWRDVAAAWAVSGWGDVLVRALQAAGHSLLVGLPVLVFLLLVGRSVATLGRAFFAR
jgi:putative peptide zinc metalloprotease protein